MKLQSSTSEFQELSEQLQEANVTQAILDKLVCVHENLEMIEKDLSARDFVRAANRLDVINARLEQPACEIENEVMILSLLEQQFTVQTEKLKQDVSTAWTELVSWTIPEQDGSAQAVHLRIDSSESARKVLSNVTQALYNIGLLHQKLQTFADRLFEYILNPAIININYKFDKTEETSDMMQLTVTVTSQQTNSEPVSPTLAFQRCSDVLMFLSEKLFDFDVETGNADNRKPLMILLGDVLALRFQDALIDSCLAHAIPDSQSGLEQFSATIAETQAFQETLVNMRFVAASEKKLQEFVNNVDVHFANKKCQEILTKARQLMTSELFNTVQVSNEQPFGELPPLDLGTAKKEKGKDPLSLPANMKLTANIFSMPSCCIRFHTATCLSSFNHYSF